MKKQYNIRSDRYNYTHHFIESDDFPGYYVFRPQEAWMNNRIIFEGNPDNIKAVDTDGGPFITVGWKNDEIEVIEIKTIKDIDGKKHMLFNLKEIENNRTKKKAKEK